MHDLENMKKPKRLFMSTIITLSSTLLLTNRLKILLQSKLKANLSNKPN